MFPKSHSSATKSHPWDLNPFQNALQTFKPVPLPRPSVNCDVSWECSISIGVSFHTHPPSKPLFTTSFLALKSRVPTLLPGMAHSSQPSMSVKRACLKLLSWLIHIQQLHSPGHGRFNHRHGCHPPTAGARRLAAPRLLLQEAEPGTAKVQCLQQGAPGDLWGREVLLSHAGGLAFHHPDGPQTAHLRLPPEEGQVLTMPV